VLRTGRGQGTRGCAGNVYYPNNVAQGTWNHPRTNRLMFEAGAGYVPIEGKPKSGPERGRRPGFDRHQRSDDGPLVPLDHVEPIRIEDQTQWAQGRRCPYVTGSHAVRVGTSIWEAQAFSSTTMDRESELETSGTASAPSPDRRIPAGVDHRICVAVYREAPVSPNVGVYAPISGRSSG